MILHTAQQKEYELLDSGSGSKLERYGLYTLVRPDPEALWRKSLPEQAWKDADFEFVRTGNRTKWITKPGVKKFYFFFEKWFNQVLKKHGILHLEILSFRSNHPHLSILVFSQNSCQTGNG